MSNVDKKANELADSIAEEMRTLASDLFGNDEVRRSLLRLLFSDPPEPGTEGRS